MNKLENLEIAKQIFEKSVKDIKNTILGREKNSILNPYSLPIHIKVFYNKYPYDDKLLPVQQVEYNIEVVPELDAPEYKLLKRSIFNLIDIKGFDGFCDN